MQTTPRTTITCPVLVGRDHHVAAFSDVFTSVIAGRGQTIAIAGEAGVGKSTLARALVASAQALSPNVRVIGGGAFEGDASVPFAPVADLWRTFALSADPDELKNVVGREGSDILKLVPELAAELPARRTVSASEPEQEKRRLFQSLLQPIVRLSRDAPLLVVIEDLHWSDDTSIEFLLQLSRRVSDLAVALLFTYRTDEVGPRLARFLADLDRGRLAREVTLQRLSQSDVALMVRAMLDPEDPPRDDFVRLLYELTDGNPFFIEEVLKSLATSGDLPRADGSAALAQLEIPRSVQDAVRRRVSSLSTEAQQLLVRAAVAGRRFDLPLLARLGEADELRLLELVKELVGAQLVVEESVDRFAFRHALTQQAVYSGLLKRERRALHAEIADALESAGHAGAESRLRELAHHTYEAEAWDRAFEYACRAGELAQRLFSPAAAVAHFTRALEAAQHTGAPAPAWIFSARGRAYDALGNFEGARDDHDAALRLARAAMDRAAEWQALVDSGSLWAMRDYERAGEFFRLALDLARAGDEPGVLGRSLNRMGNWLVNVGRAAAGIEEHESALQMFTGAGDRQGVAETLDLLGMAYGMYGDLPRCVDYYGRAIELLSELGDEQRLMSALSGRTIYGSPAMAETVAASMRTLEDVRRDGEAAVELAERSGSAVGAAFAHWTLGTALGTFGRLAEGLVRAQSGLRIATEIQHEQWIIGSHYALGQLYWLLLNPDEAIAHLEAALPEALSVKSAWWIGNVSAYLSLAHLQKGDVAKARALLDDAHDIETPQTLQERRLAWARAELLLADGAAARALQLADRLLATLVDPSTSRPPPALLITKAGALSALGDDAAATDALELAEASATKQGDAPWLWRAQCALSRVYRAAGRAADAERERDEARALAIRLAANLSDEARNRFLDAAERALPAIRPPTARRAAKQEWQGLTEREREIAALVTRGRANREIAAELVLSERTVETHVGNILSKLGFGSRAQIAAWGAERGMLNR